MKRFVVLTTTLCSTKHLLTKRSVYTSLSVVSLKLLYIFNYTFTNIFLWFLLTYFCSICLQPTHWNIITKFKLNSAHFLFTILFVRKNINLILKDRIIFTIFYILNEHNIFTCHYISDTNAVVWSHLSVLKCTATPGPIYVGFNKIIFLNRKENNCEQAKIRMSTQCNVIIIMIY